MIKRIMMPVEDESGLKAQVAHHFGRAPYFAIVELDENREISKVKTEPNRSEHMESVPRAFTRKLSGAGTRHCCSVFNGTWGNEYLPRCWHNRFGSNRRHGQRQH